MSYEKYLLGFTNLGNTCYLNSIIQVLININPLSTYIIRENVIKEKYPLLFSFHNILTLIQKKENTEEDMEEYILSIGGFKEKLENIYSEFKGNEQHDTHELFITLLNHFHEMFKKISNKKPEKCCHSLKLKKPDSFIHKLFQGNIHSTITCKQCLHKSKTMEDFLILSIPIYSTINESLKQYCSDEHLENTNAYDCSYCEQKQHAVKQTQLWKLPPFLIIHLKRFNASGTKNNEPVLFPYKDLTITQAPPKYPTIHKYNLTSIVFHHGLASFGHYTAAVKENQQWFHINDETIEKETKDTLPNKDAYILIYQNQDLEYLNI